MDIAGNRSFSRTRLRQQQHGDVALGQFADYNLDRPHAGARALQKRALAVIRIKRSAQGFASLPYENVDLPSFTLHGLHRKCEL